MHLVKSHTRNRYLAFYACRRIFKELEEMKFRDIEKEEWKLSLLFFKDYNQNMNKDILPEILPDI